MATHRRVVEFQPPKLLRSDPAEWQTRQQWQDARSNGYSSIPGKHSTDPT